MDGDGDGDGDDVDDDDDDGDDNDNDDDGGVGGDNDGMQLLPPSEFTLLSWILLIKCINLQSYTRRMRTSGGFSDDISA